MKTIKNITAGLALVITLAFTTTPASATNLDFFQTQTV
jgi:hypothetical protein